MKCEQINTFLHFYYKYISIFYTILANGNPIDATQEFIAVGLCNIGNSFVQSFPINGPLARGAVNNASGVRTTLAGLYAGGLVVISLLFFTPYFRYIPRATLAGVIIAAVIFMVEVKVVKPMWRTKSKYIKMNIKIRRSFWQTVQEYFDKILGWYKLNDILSNICHPPGGAIEKFKLFHICQLV